MHHKSMNNDERYQPEACAVSSESGPHEERGDESADSATADRQSDRHQVRRSELIAEGNSGKNHDEEEAHEVD